VEAFDFAVCAWPVGLCPEVLDLTLLEEFAHCAVVDVGEGVVCHQSLSGDVVLGEESEGSFQEGGDRRRLFVAVDLGVGKA
jgi:hypothetical protein